MGDKGDIVVPAGMFDGDENEFAIAAALYLTIKGFYFKPGFIEKYLAEWLADMTPNQRAEYDRRLAEWKRQQR